MEITGRLTNDAEVRKTKDGRQLVAFCVVVNDHYKTKDGEKKEVANFFNSSYWISTKIADTLKKGSIVTLSGNVGINSYKDMSGDFHANLTFHANNIKIVAGTRKAERQDIPGNGTKDDLPF